MYIQLFAAGIEVRVPLLGRHSISDPRKMYKWLDIKVTSSPGLLLSSPGKRMPTKGMRERVSHAAQRNTLMLMTKKKTALRNKSPITTPTPNPQILPHVNAIGSTYALRPLRLLKAALHPGIRHPTDYSDPSVGIRSRVSVWDQLKVKDKETSRLGSLGKINEARRE
jgi:hypothetical protein